MSDVVILFSGQGAQKVGMGKDFYESSAMARDLFQRADEVLGFPLSAVMFEGPDEELTRTSRCQPALYLHGLVALAMLRERVSGLNPVAAAGLSLGEFTAHAAAGTFSFEDGLRLVARRGLFMEEACSATRGAMAALIGGEEDGVKALAAECGVDVANFNAPGQIVLSGTVEGIDAAVEKARDHGIRRAIKLNVAGAYHSRLMQSAQDQLASELAGVAMRSPSLPVVCNFGASEVSDPAEIRSMLEKQVTGSVRWTESIRLLCDRGHRNFIELGPGKVLAGLVAKIEKEAIVRSVEDLASLEAVVEQLG
ncbi:MAG: [acyl-carrier-protein] S-malonyltransferase [Verrucomicrobia bacterium]|nr:MAG: [acyl-carrier-protein] S-malonyltransferase [Verrucomicrobiota bacterium]TAE85885.1 MAG: [acyl-carrier-protein] S-malonyltransferase [Verrucomicrobiota bacterium]TAF27409.1 MAG: [acyl-carrier-protein] S-malonyltransferase [Verrucomicrobiota bacterium]TAF42477.1 MAG: [acyl-carrier-protein] S-malonyltransferase [Verrucomicrobiota bacterium]